MLSARKECFNHIISGLRQPNTTDGGEYGGNVQQFSGNAYVFRFCYFPSLEIFFVA